MIRGEYWWIYYRQTAIEWSHWLSGDSAPIREGSCTEVHEIPAPDGANLVLCIPGEQVRIFNVKAPARNRSRFIASLPYVLEDKLLHPPEDYHFTSLSKNKALDKVAVAVVSNGFVEDLLNRFRQRDWQVKLMLPDYLYIEETGPGVWLLDVSETPFLLRISGKPGGAALAGELTSHPPGALILALDQAETPPTSLLVRVSSPETCKLVESWGQALEAHSIKLEIIDDPRPRWAWLSRFPLPVLGQNLLSGKFAVNGSSTKQLMQFRPVMGLAAAILLVLSLQWFITGSRLESEYTGLQTAIEQTYRSVFPDARNLVDPRYQMEQQLIKLTNLDGSSAQGQFDFLELLEELTSIPVDGRTQLERLEYDGNILLLDISLADYETLERLQQQLGRTMKVKVDAAELINGRVKSRIALESRI